jgi:xylulokinase
MRFPHTIGVNTNKFNHMTRLLGIDLGTSSVKATVIDEHGAILSSGNQEYPIDMPQPDWAEQDPDLWWRATAIAVQEAVGKSDDEPIAAIGLSGQMHGTVLLDRDHNPLAPAIIWADQRSAGQAEHMRQILGEELMLRAGTRPVAGYVGSTLFWIQQHYPEILDNAAVCLLPKDYLRLKLTDKLATDATDASGTGLFDVTARRWSQGILTKLRLPLDVFPTVLESAQVVDVLSPAAAMQIDLPPGIPVVAGCGNQAAQAIGNGLVDVGQGCVTIGIGGQIFAPLRSPLTDLELRLSTMCHAPKDRWYLLGEMLSAGLSLNWLRNLLGEQDNTEAYQRLDRLAADVSPGADGLLFLPYLLGERAPLMDSKARGTFIGLSLHHERGHLARTIMEGVCFALRQILELASRTVVRVDRLLAAGNGLSSPVWRQICADVFNRPLHFAAGDSASVGAGLIAGIGAGVYRDYEEAVRSAARPALVTEPDPKVARYYEEHYQRFKSVYPLLKPLMHQLGS